ncbi:hypothetical protein C0Q90_16280 [Lacticaseibacillus paracasei]|uniref:Uncharacterized protein n=1 Tax=Lacticaseibacillus paracasei TaxID=1597 RepID=A0AB36X6S4_LACPA|nr:hypothetical protein C0Q90_16280 [Lacticaseibacillus paracasei]
MKTVDIQLNNRLIPLNSFKSFSDGLFAASDLKSLSLRRLYPACYNEDPKGSTGHTLYSLDKAS